MKPINSFFVRQLVRLSLVMLTSVLLAGGLSARAADGSWNVDTNGNWNNSANWLDGNVPGQSGGTANADEALFGKTLTATRTVTVDANRNIGSITFSNATAIADNTNSYTLSGGSLRLSAGGLIQVVPLAVPGGTNNNIITSPVQIQGDGSAVTFRNDAPGTAAGLQLNAGVNNITGLSTAGKTTTVYLEGVSTSAIIGGRNNQAGGFADGPNGGKLAVVKNDSGLWTLNPNSSFSGGLTVNAGTIRFFGSGDSTHFGTGDIIIAGTMTFNHANTTALTITNALVVGGNITFANSGNWTWNGPMNLGAATRTMTVSAANTVFAGVIFGSGGLAKAGLADLTLSGANTYAGNTTVNGGTLKLGAANAIPGGDGKGNVPVAGTLDLNGFSPVINGLSGAGTITNSVAGTQTLTVGANDQTSVFSGVITTGTGEIALTKTGAGTLTLSGGNTYSGATTVTGGELSVGTDANLGAAATTNQLILDGGTLDVSTGFTVNGKRGIIMGANGGTIDVAGGQTLVCSNILSGAGALTKDGNGTLTVAQTSGSPYSGSTIVSNGTLVVSGNLGTGAVTVKSGSTLNGTATLRGPVTVESGAVIQPGAGGNTIATLTISNSLVLSGKAAFAINRAGGQNAAKIAGLTSVTYGGTLEVANVGAAVQAGDSFQLFAAASRSGSFATYILPLPGAGLTWNLNQLATSGTISVVAASGVSYLDNGTLKVGIDLTKGGSITYLSVSGTTDNLINNHDLGRQIQQSYYSGPHPYDPYGNINPNWSDWPWNPIQTGDSYGNRSRTIAYLNDGQRLYVQCQPMQWALNNVPGECTFESWLALANNVVTVSNRLVNMRTDTTEQFVAHDQELPAVYTIGRLYRLVSYDGMAPFTGGALTGFPVTPPPWMYWNATENWAALVDVNDWGLGIYHPGAVRFIGGFAGTPGSGGPNDSQTGYMSPLHLEILDSKIEYTYRYNLIFGTLTQIRNWVYAQPRQPGCDFQFKTDRQHWRYSFTNTSDYGWPLTNGSLRVKLGVSGPYMTSPECAFYATDAPKIYIRAAYHKPGSSTATAQLYWITNNVGGITGARSKTFTVTVDDQFHTYEIDLSAEPNYTGLITRLRFDPVGAGVAGDYVDLASISSSRYVDPSPANFSYQFSAGVLTLNWPASHLGWYLQSNSVSLARSNLWFDVPGSSSVTNINCNISALPTNVFYRLRLP